MTILMYIIGSLIQFLILYVLLLPRLKKWVIKSDVEEYIRQAIILSETRLREKIAVLETALATYPPVIKELQEDIDNLYSQGQTIITQQPVPKL